MADKDTTVTIKVLADTSDFKKEMKDVTKVTDSLESLTNKYQKRGLSQHKELRKITQQHNKSSEGSGKKALALELRLKKAIAENIKEIKAQQRARGGSVATVQAELKALGQLEKQYKKVSEFRKRTGYKSLRERMTPTKVGEGSRAMAAGLAGIAIAGVSTIVGAIISTISSQVQRGYASYVQYGRARSGLAGMGAIDESKFGPAADLGFSKIETVQQMRAMGRATGQTSPVNIAQGLARSFGGDVGEVTDFMGVLTRGGQGFGGKAGKGGERQISRVMQHAFTAGMDKSRAGEHLAAVAQGIRAAQGVTGGKVDASSISSMLAFFGRSGMPGLQGAAGMQQFSKIDQGIKQAGYGGTDAASSLIMQSMGFGVPGSNVSFYQATGRAQQGVFGKGGAKNLLDVFQRFGAAGGGAGSESTNLMLSRTFNMSTDVIEAINKVIADKGGGPEALEEIEKITAQQLPLDKQLLDATKSEHLAVAQRAAKLDNRMIEIGQKNSKAIEELEDVINDMVDRMMPRVVTLLQTIADGVMGVWRAVAGDKYDVESRSALINTASATNLESIQRRLDSGTMDPGDAVQQLLDMEDQARSELERVSHLAEPMIFNRRDRGTRLRNILDLQTTAGRIRGAQQAIREGRNPEESSAIQEIQASQARYRALERITSFGGVLKGVDPDDINNRLARFELENPREYARYFEQNEALRATSLHGGVSQEMINIQNHIAALRHTLASASDPGTQRPAPPPNPATEPSTQP